MSATAQWHFGAFRLDPTHACLWRGEEVLVLPPTPFAVLQYLVTHPNRLVTKAELLDAVWPETAITDAAMRAAIGAVRKVLGDPAPTPRYIATVPRRGYRFLAPVTVVTAAAALAPQPPCPGGSAPLLVEREAVLQQLQRALAHAQHGTRQVVVVTGEPGLGKTAVVETFTAQAAAQTAVWVAYGQCVEAYGPGEAYRPILEALGELCGGPDGARLVALLRQRAPTWLVQLPWLLTATDRAQLQYELQGATRERMLREFAEVVDTLTAETPLILVLEDLHWSDTATVDLLAVLARRRPPARLLVLGTSRPGETVVHHQPLWSVMQDLQRRRLATELALTALSPEAVAAYLAARFPQQQFPATLAPWLHQRTDGNPLFLVTLVQAFVTQGVLREHQGCWTVQEDLTRLAREMPESLRHMLEQQIIRLAPERQQVLEGASVAGVEFVAAAVAVGLGATADVIEEHCEALVAQHLLRSLGVTTWPNGTVVTRYAFRHALYQQVVYERLGAGRRVRLHQRLGACLEAAYDAQAEEIAAELAEHFARGYEVRRAVHYLHRAAEQATQRYAYREAVALLTRALAFLHQLPETSARAGHELAIQMTLGHALIATRGPAAGEVAQTYARARELCHQVPESLHLAQTLVGLCLFHTMQGDHQTAQELGGHLLRLAQRLDDASARMHAHGALGITALYLGDLGPGRRHLEHGIAFYDRLTHHPMALLLSLLHGGVVYRIGVAWVLQHLGYPDQAHQRSQEALALSQAVASPFNRCNLLCFLALFHLFRREWGLAQQWIEDVLRLATAHRFVLYMALGQIVRGATLTRQDQGQEGMSHIRQGLAACRPIGTKALRPWGLAMLAESYGRLGQPEEGLTALAEARALIATTGEAFYAAEIARLQGELLLQQAAAHAPQAAACFQQALALARGQEAKSWELRAATSLARLWQQQGKQDAAYAVLAPIYGWFTEGFDTADLQEAKVLLEALGG